MVILRSNYHEYDKEEFEMEVVGETTTEFQVRLLPQYQEKFQEGSKITTIRKCLVGDDGIYKLIEKSYIQMSLFDNL